MPSTPQKTPFDMIVIGASGDLAHRKLIPSLYYLCHDGLLGHPGRIIGVARRDWDREEYVGRSQQSCREHVPEKDWNDEAWQRFSERLEFVGLSATDPGEYEGLKKLLDEAPERARVFYLATPPSLYGPASRTLHEVGLITAETRIVLEKPIGHDLESARQINKEVGEVFEERQIYRIDHYLGKETVQNLMAIRFGNALFEPMWRAEHVDHVQITVAETLGVGGRGGYYDDSGALRDMVQNHLLQLLCLVAMEPPVRLDPDSIREEKIKVLKSLRPITGSDVERKTVRGQYRQGAIDGQSVPGYLEEEGVPKDSRTETFVSLKAEIDNWRWAGVPFYLRTGKRLSEKVSEIVIQFRPVPHLLFEDMVGVLDDNRLVIRLQPDESIKLAMTIKVPGPGMQLRPVELNLNMADTFSERTPQAYERLLLDVIRGIATLFIHRDEVEAAWSFVEPILEGWEERDERPRRYGAGTWGPPESIALTVRDERYWYEHVKESQPQK